MTHRPIDNIISMADLKRTAEHLDNYWFTPGAMRFFRSRVGDKVYNVAPDRGYFVSSEQYVPYDGPAEPRKYSVRSYAVETRGDGGDWLDIDTVGEFQAYETSQAAHAEARRLQAVGISALQEEG